MRIVIVSFHGVSRLVMRETGQFGRLMDILGIMLNATHLLRDMNIITYSWTGEPVNGYTLIRRGKSGRGA